MREVELDWLSAGGSRTAHITGALAYHHEVIEEFEDRLEEDIECDGPGLHRQMVEDQGAYGYDDNTGREVGQHDLQCLGIDREERVRGGEERRLAKGGDAGGGGAKEGEEEGGDEEIDIGGDIESTSRGDDDDSSGSSSCEDGDDDDDTDMPELEDMLAIEGGGGQVGEKDDDDDLQILRV
ncbi:uncharacterized protein LOC131875934 [Cryptomeria japonica]|uniref:uncharacterized protein LOC131875934 n=1 Tax=Cryptomeria japonica TaxID=3369 RepID=UPI0027DA3C3B|nr:uncharacterized protein LOC131875934 [Cryptomeria japonica]